jgi:tRNA threonylcarbamoyladenosine biosynthesis protein TsaB
VHYKIARFMIILAFDSCGLNLSIALNKDEKLLRSKVDFSEASQAEKIVPMIAEILLEANLNYDDIDYLALTTGPGSFTAVRSGIACARAISLCCSLKTVTMSTMEAIACKMIAQSSNFDFYITILTASKKDFYIQIFDPQNKPVNDIELIEINDFNNHIENFHGAIAVGGSGLYQIESVIKNNKKSTITYLPRFPYPEARIVAHRAYQLILQNHYKSSLDPIYIRKPDAKIGKNTKLL